MHGAIRTTSTSGQNQGVSGALPLMFRGHRVFARVNGHVANSRQLSASSWSCLYWSAYLVVSFEKSMFAGHVRDASLAVLRACKAGGSCIDTA